MCEICKWTKEFEATKKPAKLTIPLTYSIGYEYLDSEAACVNWGVQRRDVYLVK